MKDSPFFIPVSNPGDTIPTETDFHTDMVLLSHANWRNRLSPKRQNTWDERRAKRRTRKKA
jgi:hypothetical protein